MKVFVALNAQDQDGYGAHVTGAFVAKGAAEEEEAKNPHTAWVEEVTVSDGNPHAHESVLLRRQLDAAEHELDHRANVISTRT